MKNLTRNLRIIRTKNAAGEPNGYVMPIWHVDQDRPIEQVYLTAIAPGAVKGPHLHYTREGRFTCVSGQAVIVMRISGRYREFPLVGSTVTVPAGVPAALYNVGKEEALLLNMPYPAWRDNSDEHTVDDWDYKVA